MVRLIERRVWREGVQEAEHRQELERYVVRSADRLAKTLRLATPFLGDRVLELGSEPWLFTQLLLEQGVAVTPTGYPRADEGPSPEVVLAWGGRRHELRQHLFDVERDPWPFADESFDCVLCMELIEHLTLSPAHMLHEANRVLAPGGALVLTTPNSISATRLAALARGRTVHWPYSGWGTLGRHNREFTPDEVRLVLEAANFRADVSTANLEGYEAPDRLGRALQLLARLPGSRPARRRDHVFALARKAGPPRLAFPESLYRAMHAARAG
jgi:SAM-dependent methyltransferase